MPRRLLLVSVTAAAVALAGTGAAAAASPTVRMTIVHFVRGCHVWSVSTSKGPSARIALRRGARLEIRVVCPMDFDLRQVAGPKVKLGGSRLYRGETRVLTFRKPGVYRLTATNVQSSQELGLDTIGPDNVLTLTVVVR